MRSVSSLQCGAARIAGDLLSCRNGLRDARLRADHGVVAHADVSGDAGLTAEHHAVADLSAPGDAHLRHDDRALSDDDVVSDLHEVVDLRPFPTRVVPTVARAMQTFAPISTSSSTTTLPSCGTLTWTVPRGRTRSRRCRSPSRVHHDALAEHARGLDRRIGVDHRAPSDLRAGADVSPRMDGGSVADLSIVEHHGVGPIATPCPSLAEPATKAADGHPEPSRRSARRRSPSRGRTRRRRSRSRESGTAASPAASLAPPSTITAEARVVAR